MPKKSALIVVLGSLKRMVDDLVDRDINALSVGIISLVHTTASLHG